MKNRSTVVMTALETTNGRASAARTHGALPGPMECCQDPWSAARTHVGASPARRWRQSAGKKLALPPRLDWRAFAFLRLAILKGPPILLCLRPEIFNPGRDFVKKRGLLVLLLLLLLAAVWHFV